MNHPCSHSSNSNSIAFLHQGHVIIEYQPWKSYINNKNASKVCKYNFDNNIFIRPEDFERVLQEDIGFVIIERRGASLSEAKGFKRPILVLKKEEISNATGEDDDGGHINSSDKKKRKGKKGKGKKRDRDCHDDDEPLEVSANEYQYQHEQGATKNKKRMK